jgi:hypothetical protein
LLPRATFHPQQVEVDWSHPSRWQLEQTESVGYANEKLLFLDPRESESSIEEHPTISEEMLAAGPPPVFTLDPSFQSACTTFQVRYLIEFRGNIANDDV